MTGVRCVVNRVLTAIVWVVALASFGLLAFLGIGPHTGRYTTLTVLSGSMRPGIPVGAVVVDTPERATALRVGQIVTYTVAVDDYAVVTHRVVRIISGGEHPVFETKGDANDAVDPWQDHVSSGSVLRVRAVIPGLGFVIRALRDRTCRIVGVLVLPTVLALWWAMNIWRDDDEEATDTVADVAVS